MQIGLVGLGRMGGNITRRLMAGGHTCVVHDINPAAIAALSQEGAAGSHDLASLVSQLVPPRTVWIMLPAGAPTQSAVDELANLLQAGDVIIDGGNTFWKDDVARAKALAPRGIHYMDVGTSGGVWGLERGYCLMIGGPADQVQRLDPIFSCLAPGAGVITRTPGRDDRDPRPAQGYAHTGPTGSGHFVKMVHNGIEYGLMQAYAEGFDILRNAGADALPEEHRFDLNIADIAEVWRRGSVITSWLLDLCAMALAADGELAGFSGFVQDSGEGRWTIEAAIAEAVPAPVLTSALYARFRSRIEESYADKLLSAMRKGFGGHVEPTRGGAPPPPNPEPEPGRQPRG